MKTTLPEIKLIGITCRTNNAAEMNPETAQIGLTLQKYFHEAVADKIPHRQKPGTTYCVYTNYESDFNGAYTYLVGEAVKNFDNVPDGLTALTIPVQHYAKFTTQPGVMPQVCINEWQKIWGMNSADLGGDRNYLADFELYDERARDPENTVLDIFVGIKS